MSVKLLVKHAPEKQLVRSQGAWIRSMLHTMRSLGRLSNTLEDVYETQIQTLAMYVLRTAQRATFKAMGGKHDAF